MSGYTIAALVGIGLLVGGYLLHREHQKRVTAERLADWLTDYYLARLRTTRAEVDEWRVRAGEANTLLAAERAYSNLCDRQLRKLAAQVAGQALIPTLAADDVVVAFPKRGAR